MARRKRITRNQKVYSFQATDKMVMDCLDNGARIATVKEGLAYGLSVVFGNGFTMVVKEKTVNLGHTVRKYAVCPKKYMAYAC